MSRVPVRPCLWPCCGLSCGVVPQAGAGWCCGRVMGLGWRCVRLWRCALIGRMVVATSVVPLLGPMALRPLLWPWLGRAHALRKLEGLACCR